MYVAHPINCHVLEADCPESHGERGTKGVGRWAPAYIEVMRTRYVALSMPRTTLIVLVPAISDTGGISLTVCPGDMCSRLTMYRLFM